MAACAPAGETAAPSGGPVYPTFTAPPGVTPSPTPTHTAIIPPTFTPVPSPTPTATLVPPTATPTPEACLFAGGQITQHTLRTATDPLPWEFRVYTPPCYNEHPDARYPLLILIHGSTFNDSQWDNLGADETADTLIASGKVSPFIILMPRDRVWNEPTEDPFGEALIASIIPWVDQNYRTLTDRPHRAIGGLSRGASWAVHLGFKYWQSFGAIGGHSLPVFLTDPPRLSVWLDAIPADQLPRIYLDIGDKDYLLTNALEFEAMLTARNIPHEWHLYTGRHEEAYWNAHVEEYLRWYAAGW